MRDLMPEDAQVTWVLWLAIVVAFLLAFSVGANDVSNSFGTSVGSKVLTVTQACILATIFEVAGSALLGQVVCDFFRRNMYKVELYDNRIATQYDLMIGALGCLVGSAAWNMIATKLKMPISGTHSVIGATVGFNLVIIGFDSIQWNKIWLVVASWFISPLISGAISSLIYIIISKKIIANTEPLKNGLIALPLFYGATLFINVCSLTIQGPNVFHLNQIPWYGGLALASMVFAITVIGTRIMLVPKVHRRIIAEITRMDQIHEAEQNKPDVKIMISDEEDEKRKSLDINIQQDGDIELKTLKSIEDNSSNKHSKEPDDPHSENIKTEEPTVAGEPKEDKSPKDSNDLNEPNNSLTPDEQSTSTDTQKVENEVISKQQEDHESRKNEVSPREKTVKPKRVNLMDGERVEVFRLFSSLQILTACFASFAHGTNDVSNAVAPLIPIWNIWSTGREDVNETTQVWLLFFGGLGICAGLWAWGRAVMKTVGTGLTQLTPSKGFSIEMGAAISVLLASKFGIPISTTHCKVGSLVILGMVSERFCSRDNLIGLSLGTRRISRLWAEGILSKEEHVGSGKVDWKLFGNIAITWILTVPLACIAAAITTLILRAIAPELK